MRKRIVMTVAWALLLTGVQSLSWAAGQETAKEGESQGKPADAYKVEFTVNELENGKKANARNYSMLIRAEALPKWTDWKRLGMGSKVRVPSGAGAFQIEDVSMNIDCRLMPMGSGKVALSTNWDYSSLGGEQGHDTQNPVIRHVRSEVEAVVPLDKPTVVAEVDDVASTNHFAFEVKVTKTSP